MFRVAICAPFQYHPIVRGECAPVRPTIGMSRRRHGKYERREDDSTFHGLFSALGGKDYQTVSRRRPRRSSAETSRDLGHIRGARLTDAAPYLPSRVSASRVLTGLPRRSGHGLMAPVKTVDGCPSHVCAADQGLMTSTPMPSKSRTFLVTRIAPREWTMAAIWQSASPIGRPARRRSDAMSA